MVEANLLGRKTERGYYDYREGASRPAPREDEPLGRAIVDRILAMLINEAVDAVFWGVAKPSDIDLAMVKGVNYPKGLIAWAEELGYKTTLGRLEALQAEYGEDRYRPSPLLRRLARSGGMLLS
jgi:3-hydroxybutyryl-CoA dehydrogenase